MSVFFLVFGAFPAPFPQQPSGSNTAAASALARRRARAEDAQLQEQRRPELSPADATLLEGQQDADAQLPPPGAVSHPEEGEVKKQREGDDCVRLEAATNDPRSEHTIKIYLPDGDLHTVNFRSLRSL